MRGRMGAESAIGDKDDGRGELLDLEVGKGDMGRVGGFGSEGDENFVAGKNTAGGAELCKVAGEQEFEAFGVVPDGWGEELPLKGFEVSGERRNGGSGDRGSLSLWLRPRSQTRDLWHPDSCGPKSEIAENVLAGDAFMLCDLVEDRA